MALFSPRLSEPYASNKYYVNHNNGGYNTAIVMNNSNGYVIPNCVGYAQGRFREIRGDKDVWSKTGCHLAGNAETFFERAKQNGFETGQIPKLGAIIVWEGVGSAAGHVAVVEKINRDSNGKIISILTSNSAYNGTHFYTQTLTAASGFLYQTNGSRPLLGFIYCGIDFDEDIPVKDDSSETYKERDIVMLNPGVKWNNGSIPASWVFNKELTVKRIDGDILVLSTQGYDGGVTGTIHYSCVHKKLEQKPSTPVIPKKDSLSKDEIVHFTGNYHYTSSYSSGQKKPASPCEAKVTSINSSKSSSVVRHYHLVGDGVYGWVDDKDIKELN